MKYFKSLFKNTIAFTLVAGIAFSSISASAAILDKSPTPKDELLIMPIQEDLKKTPEIPNRILIEKKDMVISKDVNMVPLRNVIEGTNLTLSWNQENKVATILGHSKTVAISIDGQYKDQDGKTLDGYEKALLKEDRLYVPANLLTEQLPVLVDYAGDTLIFRKTPVAKAYSGFGEISEIQRGSNAYLVTIRNQFDQQTYTLVVSDKTEIVERSADGKSKTKTAKDLKVRDMIYTEYSAAMTRSIPPQTGAEKIEIMKDMAVSYGIVEKVEDDAIIIASDTSSGIVIRPLEDAMIETEDGKKLSLKDIKVGDRIRVYHSPVNILMLPVTYPTFRIVK